MVHTKTDREYQRGLLPDEWNLSFIALLVYSFGSVTGRLPVGTAAVVVGLLGLCFLKRPLRLGTPVTWMTVFLLWCSLGYFSASFPDVVSSKLFEYLKLVLVACLIVNAVRTRLQATFLLVTTLGWYILFPVRVTLVNYFISDHTLFGRAVGPGLYSNPNDLAALTLLQASVAVSLVPILESRILRLGVIAAALSMALTIVLTQSRGVLFGSITFLLILVGSGQKKLKKLMLIALAFTVILFIVPTSTFDRFEKFAAVIGSGESVDEADEEGSAAARSDIVRIAMLITRDHPVTGVGFGSYPLANEQYARNLPGIEAASKKKVDAHSTYLSIVAETGVPGLFLYLVLLFAVIRSMRRAKKSIEAVDPNYAAQLGILIAGFIGFLIAALVGTYSSLAMLYLHMCAMWALADSLRVELGREMDTRPNPGRSFSREFERETGKH